MSEAVESAVANLLGQILAAPLLFVLMVVVVNLVDRARRKSRVRSLIYGKRPRQLATHAAEALNPHYTLAAPPATIARAASGTIFLYRFEPEPEARKRIAKNQQGEPKRPGAIVPTRGVAIVHYADQS